MLVKNFLEMLLSVKNSLKLNSVAEVSMKMVSHMQVVQMEVSTFSIKKENLV